MSEQSSKFLPNMCNISDGSENINEENLDEIVIKMSTTVKHDYTNMQPSLNSVNVKAQVHEYSIKRNVFQTTRETEIICTITYNDVSFIMYLGKPYKNNNNWEDMICRCEIKINNKLVTSTPRMSYMDYKGLQNKIDSWNNLYLAIRNKKDKNTTIYAIQLFNALFYPYMRMCNKETMINEQTREDVKIDNAIEGLHTINEKLPQQPTNENQHDNNKNEQDNNIGKDNNIGNKQTTVTDNSPAKLNTKTDDDLLCKICNCICG